MFKEKSDSLVLLQEAIEDVTGVPAAEVTPEKSLLEDIELDSLSLVEVVFALQKATGHALPEDRLADVVTVQDLVHLFDDSSMKQ